MRPRTFDTTLAERVKGDARMAAVLAHAVADRQRPLRRGLRVPFGARTLVLSERALAGMVQAVKRRGGTHNGRRRIFEAMVVRALAASYHAASSNAASSNAASSNAADAADTTAELRRHPAVVDGLNRMWPILTPEDFLNDLFGAGPLLELATRDVLTPEERASLARPRAHTLDEVEWTPADVPLLDEARALLGSPRSRRSSGLDDDVRGYGHIVVDEAQDVTPMALRMLGRRSISGSMTLVGDIGQATTALAPADWESVLTHLPRRRPARVARLTVNYRTPAEIMDVAGAVLAAADVPGVTVPRSVRRTGRTPSVMQSAMLVSDVAAVARAESQAVDGGTVAVIAPEALRASLSAALDDAGLPWGSPDRTGLSAAITLLDLPSAKGLEFDSVVVVEPAAFELRSLYVALTRTTRRLAIVHASPLPPSLAEGLASVARGSDGRRHDGESPSLSHSAEH